MPLSNFQFVQRWIYQYYDTLLKMKECRYQLNVWKCIKTFDLPIDWNDLLSFIKHVLIE